METIELVKKVVESLEDKKAEDITVIDIREVSSIADYFIIANGSNANQLTAMEMLLMRLCIKMECIRNKLKVPQTLHGS